MNWMRSTNSLNRRFYRISSSFACLWLRFIVIPNKSMLIMTRFIYATGWRGDRQMVTPMSLIELFILSKLEVTLAIFFWVNVKDCLIVKSQMEIRLALLEKS